MGNCSKCSKEVELSRGSQRYCRSCHNEYARLNRSGYSDMSESQKGKSKARAKVRYALKVGTIKKCSCLLCDVFPAQAHHEDYNKPLDVIWLCEPCHKLYHNTFRY